jgi:hypothetical protein
MSGRNPWPGGHGAGDVLDAVFLLGGGAEVHPLPLLPLCPGESPKSSDWAAVALWRRSLRKAPSWVRGKGACCICSVFRGDLGR